MRPLLLATLLCITSVLYAGNTWYASPAGGGSGSIGSPWGLTNALASGHGVAGGDTIYLRGGTYRNPNTGRWAFAWVSTISGSARSPIIVRAYPGEHPVLDGLDTHNNDMLNVQSSYVWYWGLEITSSDPGRIDPTNVTSSGGDDNAGSYPNGTYMHVGSCVTVNQDNPYVGIKFISCIIHDGGGGISSTGIAAGVECYNCIFYNNGWWNSYYAAGGKDSHGNSARGPHGHNIYIHNTTGHVCSFYDCIDWGAFENNVQAWGGVAGVENNDYVFNGFVSWLYGSEADGCCLLIGNQYFSNPTVTNSFFYSTLGHPNIQWGYYNNGDSDPTVCTGGTITGNYFAGGEQKFDCSFPGTTINSNFTYYETVAGHVGTFPPGFGQTTSRPTTNAIYVRPWSYETGKATVVVYNWTGALSVSVDLSSVISNESIYKIVDAQNPLGGPIASGIYSGPVSIPMTGMTIAQPVGNGTEGRTHTPPEFGAFIVSSTSTSAPSANVNVKVKFSLQGPYSAPTNAMLNTLNRNGLLALHFGATPVPSSAVDSVNIEIRNTASAPTVRAFAPAWLLTDGSIRDFNDTTKTFVGFPGLPSGSYYVVVGHRNHIAVMSSASISLDGGVSPSVYDFSTAPGQAYGTNAMIQTGTHFSLISGVSSNVDQVINASDRTASRNSLGDSNYNFADVNLDGVVNATDRIIERTNLGLSGQVP
jgi:hypothetical protein